MHVADTLIDKYTRCTDDFYFFWTDSNPFSNWYPGNFVWSFQEHHHGECALMWAKAKLFGDEAIAAKILCERDPGEAKRLGKLVSGFNKAQWDSVNVQLMRSIAMAKFSQSADFKELILDTGSRHLVEASPKDDIWGIGLAAYDPRVTDPNKWKGENRLGKALISARQAIAENPTKIFAGKKMYVPPVFA